MLAWTAGSQLETFTSMKCMNCTYFKNSGSYEIALLAKHIQQPTKCFLPTQCLNW